MFDLRFSDYEEASLGCKNQVSNNYEPNIYSKILSTHKSRTHANSTHSRGVSPFADRSQHLNCLLD